MSLEDRLERLATRAPLGNATDVLDNARTRTEAAPESRRPRILAAAAALLAIVALAAGGLALIGSDDSDSVTVAGPDEFQAADGLDGLWRVVSTIDDGERQPAEGTANLRFDGDGVQGSDGCNNRIVTTFDDGVVVPPNVRTQVGCPDDSATVEADLFWAGLGQPVELRDGELWLLADDGDGLVFSRVDENREMPAEAGPTVTVAVDGFGPVEAAVSPLTASEQGWLEHTVTLTNTGTETLHLQDFRTGTMLGDREVAAATDGCGYGSSGDQPVMMGCRSAYRPVTIQPGETHTFTVTLWRDLAGMNPVGDEPYEWSLSVDRRDTPFDHPDQTGTTGTVRLAYKNLSAAAPGDICVQADDSRPSALCGGVDGPVMFGPEQRGEMEQALLTGRLIREGDCLYLLQEANSARYAPLPVVWPYGASWQESSEGVLLADGTLVAVGASFTASGGIQDIDRLVELGHAQSVAGRAQSCGADVPAVAYVQGEVDVVKEADERTVELLWFEMVNDSHLELTLSYCGNNFWFDVEETEKSVTIRAQTSDPEFPPAPDCATAGTVALESPLGSRQVIDTATGATVEQR